MYKTELYVLITTECGPRTIRLCDCESRFDVVKFHTARQERSDSPLISVWRLHWIIDLSKKSVCGWWPVGLASRLSVRSCLKRRPVDCTLIRDLRRALLRCLWVHASEPPPSSDWAARDIAMCISSIFKTALLTCSQKHADKDAPLARSLYTFIFYPYANCAMPIKVKHQIGLQKLFIKKQAIYLMLYKRWYKTAKIKKYKHEHVLAYTFNLPSVARINRAYRS